MLEHGATEATTDEQVLATTSPAPPPEPPRLPAMVGRFQILGELGRGGMGVVYEAYDARLDRRVAVKVVDLYRVGPRGRARVRREARALARLSHPNVVQVFEVGEDPHEVAGSTLFLAMEHVEGVTLRQWRAAAPRGWQEVLAVYRQAAEGLAAAHDKGLVHRDFKPDNAIIGSDGRVRVLDFGLAREQDPEALDDEGADMEPGSDTVTEHGAVVGTPAYMAPEQFLGARLDARTDQFALCVSLYEALYGRRPFEGPTRLALADAVTKGQLVPPPDDREEPPWVLAALRRGLQPSPSARFPELRALLDALEPPRRRGRWVALGLVTAALAGWGAWETTQAAAPCLDAAPQWQAVWSPVQRTAVARALAEAPVPYAEHTSARVVQALDAYGARWIEEHTAACTATRVLGRASAEVMVRRMACLASGRRRFVALVDVLAQADAEVAEHAVQAAAELPVVARCADERHMAEVGQPPADPAQAARVEALREDLDVAIAWHDAGRYAAAHERAAAVVEQAESLGHRPLLARARLWLGRTQSAMGEPNVAVQTLRAAFFDARAADMDELAARAATFLVFEEGYRLDRYEAAEAWAEHARTALERLGRDPVEPALHMAMANVDLARGRYEAGRLGHERAVEGYVAQLGPAHPQVAKALANLANAHFYLGDLEAALALYQRVIELEREALGPSHPQVSLSLGNLGSVYMMMDRHDEALAQLQAALELDLVTLGPSHPRVLETRGNIAGIHWKQGHFSRALDEQRQIVALAQEIFGDDGVEVAGALSNMAGSLVDLGRHDEAASALRRAVAIVEQRLPPDHPDLAQKLHNLALVEHELGLDEAALDHGLRALSIRERRLPALHFDRSASLLLLAGIHESRGEPRMAVDAAARALEIRERGTTASAGELANASMALARLRWESGGDRAHAHALARRARDGFLAEGTAWQEQYEDAVEWLERHPWPAAGPTAGEDVGPTASMPAIEEE